MHHNIDAEQQLLGAIFINNDALARVSDMVEADHFFEPIHREIFAGMVKLAAAGKLIKPQLMLSILPPGLQIGPLSLQQYLARLMAEATTIINAPDFAMAIRDDYDRRELNEMGMVLCGPIPDPLALASDIVDHTDKMIAARSGSHAAGVSLADATMRAMGDTAAAYQNEGRLTGLSWGLQELDKKTLGMHPGQLIVIAGRPGMGKTAIALCVARNLGHEGKVGMIFSLEMDEIELSHRMISDEMYDTGPLAYMQLRSGRFHESVFGRVRLAQQRLAPLPMKIEPQAAQSMSQIASRARRHKKRYGLDYLIVDHIGLMKASGNYRGNKVLETGEITAGLKALAKELKIPVIVLAQLNRAVEAREDKRPNLADLRHSGDIEQDADLVMMIYRPAYYIERQMPDARPDSEEYAVWEIKMREAMNKVDVLIEKQRSGPVGTVRLHCSIANNAIRNLPEGPPDREFAPLPDDAGDLT